MSKDGNTSGGKMRSYISYFQSVTTVGIVSQAPNAKAAAKEAAKKIQSSELKCGIIAQTPFKVATTEEWRPSLSN